MFLDTARDLEEVLRALRAMALSKMHFQIAGRAWIPDNMMDGTPLNVNT